MSKKDKSKDKRPEREELRSTADFDIPVCGPGTQIGQFRIEREIGRGGMGVVYLAHDSKLDRQVAIKSIPPVLSDDTKVKSRFRREAKLLASLDHPDIATIYDIIEGDKGIDYLVLEYIPGDTLSDCIARGSMSPKDVLSVGGQIASAFASAHEHGIVHRDLKPANIKITKEQRIKVLDFGIAKAAGGEASDAYTTVTEPGQLIGTPAYMSPEQARGKPSDERGDIWSFGCVLYEMLTGKPPFQGETASDTLAGVLQREPDWDALPQTTPANVKLLIRRCLEKDPQQRLQHMGDAALEIRETVNLPAVVPPMTLSATTAAQPTNLRRSIIAKAATLIVTAVMASLISMSLFRSSPPPPSGTIKFSTPLTTTDGAALIPPKNMRMVLSPDGKLLILGNGRGATTRLYVRSMDSFETKPIPGTENAYDPFLSPDGQWLAFFTQDAFDKRSLWKMRVDQNGRKVFLAKGQRFYSGGTWSNDNVIFFCGFDANDSRAIFQISADGGTPEIFSIANPNSWYWYPCALPDNKTIMYNSGGIINLLSRATGKSTVLVRNANGGCYSHTGHVLFTRDEHLYAIPIDLDKLKITGPEVLVIRDVLGLRANSLFDLARNGTLAYVPLPPEAPSLVWVDREGNVAPVKGSPERRYRYPSLSPDKTEVAVSIAENDRSHIWKYDLNRHVSTQLTFGPLWAIAPHWIPPDGNRISFDSWQDVYKPQLFSLSIDGTGKAEPLLPIDLNFRRRLLSWSPDGKYLGYSESTLNIPRTWILPFGKDGKPGEPALFLDVEQRTRDMRFRPPDGGCIAYASEKAGRNEIFIKEFLWGNLSEGWVERISSEGGTEPCWSRDGRKLFYRSPSGMMEVLIHSNPDGTIDVGESQVLFGDSIFSAIYLGRTNYDVTSDERFLMIKEAPPKQINVILNFDEELKRLAPTGKK